MHKSRLEARPSMLPKPRRPGSTDRLSTEARRPSTTGHRSSSAEPRGTFGKRISRDASATKLQTHGRSRSQLGERFGQSSMTPLRSSQLRATTTPIRTPSEDRTNRSWQASLDRALAFVTIKDQRPISNLAWQRSELSRIQATLAAREGGNMQLVRPLTIARFVDIIGALLNAINGDTKLNNDNYVAKLPHVSKHFLYPGTVSKSWLKTVNTLHAFPQALALIAYIMDLVNHIEAPVPDQWLHVGKNDVSCLRRDYLNKCWIRFQEPDSEFDDLNEDYLQGLKSLLGNDDEKIIELQQVIKKYECSLEVEMAARAEESRWNERCGEVLASLRAERSARGDTRELSELQRGGARDAAAALHQLELDIERLNAESDQLRLEVENQPLSVAERLELADQIEYANRVYDTKTALTEHVTKILQSRENELALWQKLTLDTCMKYKQGLIHLSTKFPDLAAIASCIDEKELMGAECAGYMSRGVASLRARHAALLERRDAQQQQRNKQRKMQAATLEECRTKIAELKKEIPQEQEALDSEAKAEAQQISTWNEQVATLTHKIEELHNKQAEYKAIDEDLQFWENQDHAWRTKLSEMREYIQSQKDKAQHLLREATDNRVQLLLKHVNTWNEKLA